jgi:hypothetical protein
MQSAQRIAPSGSDPRLRNGHSHWHCRPAARLPPELTYVVIEATHGFEPALLLAARV